MATETLEADAVITAVDAATDMERYYPTDSAIAELSEKFMPLTILGPNDSKGFKEVHAARMTVKNLRVKVDKTREALKAPVLKLGRDIDAVAKGILGKLAPIESHLEGQENDYEAAKEKIKQEAEAKRAAALQARVDAFQAVNYIVPVSIVEAMSEEVYQQRLALATEEDRQKKIKAAAEETERKRLADEEAARQKIEADRLAAERAELEKLRAEQQAEANRLAAESKRIADEDAARQRAIEIEKAKAEAAERARLETEARIKADADAAALKAHQEQVERERQARLAPDKDKLTDFALAVDAMQPPRLSASNQKLEARVIQIMDRAANEIRKLSDSLE